MKATLTAEPIKRTDFHVWVGERKLSAYHNGAAETIGIAINEIDRRKQNQ